MYDHGNEASESENENSFEISEQNGTTCRYVQCKIQKFIKIRITLPCICEQPVKAGHEGSLFQDGEGSSATGKSAQNGPE